MFKKVFCLFVNSNYYPKLVLNINDFASQILLVMIKDMSPICNLQEAPTFGYLTTWVTPSSIRVRGMIGVTLLGHGGNESLSQASGAGGAGVTVPGAPLRDTADALANKIA